MNPNSLANHLHPHLRSSRAPRVSLGAMPREGQQLLWTHGCPLRPEQAPRCGPPPGEPQGRLKRATPDCGRAPTSFPPGFPMKKSQRPPGVDELNAHGFRQIRERGRKSLVGRGSWTLGLGSSECGFRMDCGSTARGGRKGRRPRGRCTRVRTGAGARSGPRPAGAMGQPSRCTRPALPREVNAAGNSGDS